MNNQENKKADSGQDGEKVKKKGKEIMKKNIKKCFALLLAVVMTLTMAMTVFADDDNSSQKGTIVVNNANPGSTYTLYKLADWQVDGAKVHSLVINSKYKNVFTSSIVNELKGMDPTSTDPSSNDYWAKSDTQSRATNMMEMLKGKSGDKVVTLTTEQKCAEFAKLDFGYYLIAETATSGAAISTAPILVGVTSTTPESVETKKSETNVTKVIEKNGKDYSKSTEDIGDTVHYRLDAQVPVYEKDAKNIKFWLTDQASKGLTVNLNTISVVGVDAAGGETPLSSPNAYEVTTLSSISSGDEYNGGNTFVVKFAYNEIKTYKYVSVRYDAELNSNCVIEGNGNPNEVKLTYTNNWVTGSTKDTDWTEVRTYTYKFNIYKKWKDIDGQFKPLAGAEFVIYKQGTNEYVKYYKESETSTDVHVAISKNVENEMHPVFVTGEDGYIYLVGLDEGEYVIKETKAPDNFNLAPEATFTITTGKQTDAAKEIITTKEKDTEETTGIRISGEADRVEIEDTKGISLPGTGGIGTTLFTFGGIALILIAGVMFIIYTRKQKKQS